MGVDSERMNNFEFGEHFKLRTKNFALRVLKLFQALPKSDENYILGKQLLRAATSVAANYRSACRARSTKEFSSKIGIVLEEADESLFWLEFLEEAGLISPEKNKLLKQEAQEIVAITSKIRKSTSKKKEQKLPTQ